MRKRSDSYNKTNHQTGSYSNKAKGPITKRMLQEIKTRQICRKKNIFYQRVRIRGKEIFVFKKIWRLLFYFNIRFEIRLFALVPANYYLTVSQVLPTPEYKTKI